MNHPTVARISISNLKHNMQVLQEAVGPSVKLWPAVKANAYGHGAVLISRNLVDLGYTTMCVAHIREALELLEAGVGVSKILILAGMLPAEAPDAVRFADTIEPVVSSMTTLKAIADMSVAAKVVVGVHLQIDTGMTRQGCPESEFKELLEAAQIMEGIVVRGVMSHFAKADADEEETTQKQIEIFDRQPFAGERHLCNSAGTLRFPKAHYDACRPGISIYGLHPGAGVTSELSKSLKPVLSLESRISLVRKEVPRGTGVSYGHSFVTLRDLSTLAVVPIGYGEQKPQKLTLFLMTSLRFH